MPGDYVVVKDSKEIIASGNKDKVVAFLLQHHSALYRYLYVVSGLDVNTKLTVEEYLAP